MESDHLTVRRRAFAGVGFSKTRPEVAFHRGRARPTGFARCLARLPILPHRGMPRTGRISGSLRGASIRFTKRMPVSYVTHEGRHISVRDWLRDHGYDPGYEVPHQLIVYRGTFTNTDAASGTWRIAGGLLY